MSNEDKQVFAVAMEKALRHLTYFNKILNTLPRYGPNAAAIIQRTAQLEELYIRPLPHQFPGQSVYEFYAHGSSTTSNINIPGMDLSSILEKVLMRLTPNVNPFSEIQAHHELTALRYKLVEYYRKHKASRGVPAPEVQSGPFMNSEPAVNRVPEMRNLQSLHAEPENNFAAMPVDNNFLPAPPENLPFSFRAIDEQVPNNQRIAEPVDYYQWPPVQTRAKQTQNDVPAPGVQSGPFMNSEPAVNRVPEMRNPQSLHAEPDDSPPPSLPESPPGNFRVIDEQAPNNQQNAELIESQWPRIQLLAAQVQQAAQKSKFAHEISQMTNAIGGIQTLLISNNAGISSIRNPKLRLRLPTSVGSQGVSIPLETAGNPDHLLKACFQLVGANHYVLRTVHNLITKEGSEIGQSRQSRNRKKRMRQQQTQGDEDVERIAAANALFDIHRDSEQSAKRLRTDYREREAVSSLLHLSVSEDDDEEEMDRQSATL
jgi:hypothetical protein